MILAMLFLSFVLVWLGSTASYWCHDVCVVRKIETRLSSSFLTLVCMKFLLWYFVLLLLKVPFDRSGKGQTTTRFISSRSEGQVIWETERKVN